jgi:hypothetical protein
VLFSLESVELNMGYESRTPSGALSARAYLNGEPGFSGSCASD